MRYNRAPQATYDIDIAWAAVAGADRINGGNYINQNTYPIPEGGKFNKAIAYDLAENPQLLTEEDKNLGALMHEHFKGLLMRKLAGPITNGFLDNIAEIVAKDKVSRFDIACMAALPRTYRKDLEREAKTAREQSMITTSEYLGQVGSKQRVSVEIMDMVYSRNYNIHIVTATDGTNIIKFSTAHDPARYPKGQKITISGTIKRCLENDRTGVKETWLTRVKEAK